MSKVVEVVGDIVEGVWDATIGALFDGLSPDIDQPEQETATLAKGLQKGIDKPRRITFGRDRVGGVIAHQATVTRSDKEFIQLIVLINGAPIDALEDIFIANKRLSTYPSESYDYSLSNGHHTQANAKAISKMQGWTSKHIGFRQAHVFIEFENNRDVFPDGISDCEFLIRGARVWDPRDGVQKSDNESTWKWSQNAVLCTLHYVRFYGANQVPLQNLPLTWWKAAASVCDEQVPFTESNIEKHEARYTINGTFSFTSKPLEVLQQLERSFAGKVFRQMGQWYVRVGAWYGNPTYTVKSDDIRGDVKIKWHADLKARANIVRAQFVDPNQEYERTDAPPVIAEGYLQQDAQPLEQTLSLPFVRSSATAQRLAAIKLEQTRLGSIELPLKHVGLRAAVGRTIKVHIPEYHINNKTYRVVGRKFKLDGAVTIQCIEDSAALWADNMVPGVNDLTPNTDYVAGQLKPVEDLALSIQKDAYIKVTWSHDAPDAVDHYLLDIYQHYNGQNNQLHRLKYSYLSAILPTLQVGSYIVEVRAVNVRGKASVVNSIDFVVDRPAKPSVVTDISHNTVTLSAVINDNTLGTQIQWQWLGTDEEPSTGPLIKSPIYTKTALTPDTLYNYQVRAINTLGESPWSSKVIKTQKAPKRQEFAALNFELSQSPMWIGLGDGWLPATLSNTVRVSLKDKQTHTELAYQVIKVTLDDETGFITALLTDDKLNKTEDELVVDIDGQGTPALTITAIHNSDVVHQTFSATGVNPQDIKDIKQDMSDIDAIAQSVLEQALDSEHVFDADLTSTLHLEQKTDTTNAVVSEAAAAQATVNEATAIKISTVKSEVDDSKAQITQVSQTLATTEQALSTQITNVSAEADNSKAQITHVSQALATAEQALSTDITNLTSTVNENHSEIKHYYITKVDSQAAVSQAKTELSSEFNGNFASLDQTFYTKSDANAAIAAESTRLEASIDGRLGAVSDSINVVKSDVKGNNSALSALTLRALDIEGNITAVNSRVDIAQSDADGNASAISALALRAENIEQGVDANASQISDVKTTAEGAATATQNLSTRVSNSEGRISSANLILQSHAGTLGQLSARAELGVDVNGTVTGMTITPGKMRIKAGTFELLDNSNNSAVYFDSSSGKYTFTGHIVANSGSFSGHVNATSGTFTGNVYANSGTFKGRVEATSGVFKGRILMQAGTVYTDAINISAKYSGRIATIINFSPTSSAKGLYIGTGGNNALEISGKEKAFHAHGTKNVITVTANNTSATALWAGSLKLYAGGGYLPFTGQHRVCVKNSLISQLIPGDLLVETQLVGIEDISNALFEGALSNHDKQTNVIGVYVRHREIEINSGFEELGVYQAWAEQNLHDFQVAEVNSVGDGMMNVVGTNGNIQQGDLLCASTILGKAHKQDDNLVHNYTVAKARQNLNFECSTDVAQIPVFYMCG
ncbi:hypothetical protein J8L98_22025 [Pseudoalteromonas sp. MMG013]|uniref:hypothetical protein n=1 Tax=Pseudoalteromonas sp. MMG013 TaxID=2822687 RepID=UPI001B399063|nr:hypothetical protein [Pseudoalteromonas sp. MMG013]MBQ4864373.1 hypothetical protein [Pseudoalteromonas sp. MMG013]